MQEQPCDNLNVQCEEDKTDTQYLLNPMKPYVVQLTNIEVKTYKYGDSLMFYFTVMGGKKLDGVEPAKGLVIRHLVSKKLTPSSDLWNLVQSMTGVALQTTGTFHVGSLINQYYVILPEHHQKDGKYFNRVKSIQKWTPPAQAPQPPAQVAQPVHNTVPTNPVVTPTPNAVNTQLVNQGPPAPVVTNANPAVAPQPDPFDDIPF